MRALALVASAIALAATITGCDSDQVKTSKTECRAFAYAIGSIDSASAASAMKTCDEITDQNADQTIYDMQQNCVRLASSQQRAVDKNIPNEKTVSARNSGIAKCNAASALVRSGG